MSAPDPVSILPPVNAASLLLVDAAPWPAGFVERLLAAGQTLTRACSAAAASALLAERSFEALLAPSAPLTADFSALVGAARARCPAMPAMAVGDEGKEALWLARVAGLDAVLRDDLTTEEVVQEMARVRRSRVRRSGDRDLARERRVLVVAGACEAKLLRDEGFSVLLAAGPPDALRLVHEDAVHVVVTAATGSKLAGAALIASIRRFAPDIEVVAVGEQGQPEATVRALRAGAMDIVLEPVSARELCSRVERAWGCWLLGAERQPPRFEDVPPVRLLLVEDDPTQAILTGIYLADDVTGTTEIIEAQDLKQALARVEEGVDIVLLDLNLPDAHGLEAYLAVRSRAPGVPILVTTGTADGGLAGEFVQSTGEGWLYKGDLDGPMLSARVRHAISRKATSILLERYARDRRLATSRLREVKHLQARNEGLERLAHVDPLTGVLNRRGLQDRLDAEHARFQRVGSSLGAVMLDCDDFKQINETRGHAVGDAVLAEVGARLRAAVRPIDSVGRIGGDEFLVLLPDTRAAEAVLLAERFRQAVAETPIGDDVTLTVSLAAAGLGGAATIRDVLVLCRGALRQSKDLGKDQVSAVDLAAKQTGITLLAELLPPGGIRARWQPIVRLSDEEVVGYELLARGPVGRLESPQDFLGEARAEGILDAVDLECMRVLLGAAVDALPDGSDRILHVNMFPSTLLDTPMEQILSLLSSTLERCTVCIEISEQEFVGLSDALDTRLQALRDAGFLIAIDDIGGMPGAIDTVLMHETDIMKIDRSVVDGIDEDRMKQRLLRRLLKLARTLNLHVIAEGVERQEEAAMLRSLGVTEAQGFLWSRPVEPV